MCDGDARIALNSLQLAVQSLKETSDKSKPSLMTVENIKDGIKVPKVILNYFTVNTYYISFLEVSHVV